MEFRLIYQGVLRASGDMAEKHEIRKQFNGQLRQLWNVHPGLSRWMQEVAAADGRTGLQLITEEHGGFAPLVTEEWALACELEILFLRREGPGHIVTSGGGDIDNRIKVLFDALRKPQHREVRPLSEKEKPFFVLLEDDSLITKVTVTADRLLTEAERPAYVNHVHLVVTVRVNPVSLTIGNTAFLT